jgi:hypothetical protein
LSLLVCYPQGVVVGHAGSAAQVTYLIVESHNSSATRSSSKSGALHRVGCPRASGKATRRQQVSAFPLGTPYGGNRCGIVMEPSFALYRESPPLIRSKWSRRRMA